MEQSNRSIFYQNAMKYGTYLGVFWTLTYILLFKSFNSPMLSMLASAMFISSPFVAGKLTIRYRKSECGNYMKYPQAWTFLFCMYLCATLFSTLTNYIYLSYIDGGATITAMTGILTEASNTQGLEVAAKEQLEAMTKYISELTAGNMTWSLLHNSIFSSLVMPPIIAFFVRKNTQL